MNAEIIDAIENHLRGADRVPQLWEVFEKHRSNIEAIELTGCAGSGRPVY